MVLLLLVALGACWRGRWLMLLCHEARFSASCSMSSHSDSSAVGPAGFTPTRLMP